MSTLTDPARELADICDRLRQPADGRGDEILAAHFNVAPWSREFFEIIFCILERADLVISIVNDLDLDEDFKKDAKNHIEEIKLAFSKGPIGQHWNHSGSGRDYLSPANIQPIKMLSSQIRLKVSYPKLSSDEIIDLISATVELRSWLEDHQLSEKDFIRQALIEGLIKLEFRLERFGWLGWGYAADGLRDVVAAYMALERGFPDHLTAPDAAAIMHKTRLLMEKIYSKAKSTKELVELGDFALRAYALASITIQTGFSVSGFLTSS